MFWDRAAIFYDFFVKYINRRTHKALIKETERIFNNSDIVLECACGTGMLSVPAAKKCKHLTATDFSEKMLKKAQKNCRKYTNASFIKADIFSLPFKDNSFDKVMAANVIHLLDEPMKALSELCRVCKTGGRLIIPTYINRSESGKTNGFARTVGKAGADFKQQFTFESYKEFFKNAGYGKADYSLIEGRIPCALAVITIEK